LSAHGQLYGLRGNKLSNVTADDDLFDAKDQMIHSAIAHSNVLLSSDNTNKRRDKSSAALPASVITLCLQSVGLYTQVRDGHDDVAICKRSRG